MKPNFALNILPDGLELLHRSTPGWDRVGRVDFDAEDLPAELAALRRMGEAFGPEPLRCKLVIPNDQIRYMSIYTGPATEEERRAAVMANLEGATPYPLDQLQFCWSVSGEMTHLAAVAEETLAEAEAFAMEHGFNPVSFVAIPEGGGYIGEPFFGPTSAAASLLGGESVERDAVQIHVVGNAALPPEALPRAIPDPAPDAETPPPAPEATTPVAAPEPDAVDEPIEASGEEAETPSEAPKVAEPEALEEDTARPEASEATPEVEADPEVKPAPEARIEPVEPHQPRDLFDFDAIQSEATPEDSPAETPKTTGPEATPEIPETAKTFQSKRKLAAGTDPEAGDVAQSLKASLDSLRPAPEVELEAPRRRRARRDEDSASRKRKSRSEEASSPRSAREKPREAKPPKLAAPKGKISLTAPEKPVAKAEPAPRKAPVAAPKKPIVAPAAVSPPTSVSATASVSAPAPITSGAKPLATPVAPKVAAPKALDPARQRASEAEQLTVFGERPGQAGNSPRRGYGRVAILALVLAGLGIAAWAALNGGTLLPERGEVLAEMLPEATAPATETPPETALAALPEILPESAPQTAPEAITAPERLPAAEESSEVALATPEALPPVEDPEPGSLTRSITQPRTPMQIRPAPATPAEAAARYAATGIWQRAPAAPLPPMATELGEISLAALTPTERAAPVVGLQDTARRRPTSGFSSPINPPSPDLEFELDERGLVPATAEGALTPEGHLVYLGAPEVIPPSRPEATLAPEAQPAALPLPEAAPETTAEPAAGTPAAETAAAEAAEQPLDPVIAAALELAIANDPEALLAPGEELTLAVAGSIRPRLRPEGLAPEAREPATEADLSAGVSTRPRARPQDFAVLVAAAQAAAASAPPLPVPSPAVIPPGPSQPSVARLATVERAIDLNRINLIGIRGEPSSRQALVRLADGRIRKVQVGDRLDGGRVAAIGDSALTYVKKNRSVQLEMPD